MKACSSPGVRSMCRSFRSSISLRQNQLARSMSAPLQTADRAVSAQRFAASVGSRCATMSCTALRQASTFATAWAVSRGNGLGGGLRMAATQVGAKGSCCLRRRLPTRCSRYKYCAAVVRLNSFPRHPAEQQRLQFSGAALIGSARVRVAESIAAWSLAGWQASLAGWGWPSCRRRYSAQHRLPGLLNGLGEVFWQRRLHVRLKVAGPLEGLASGSASRDRTGSNPSSSAMRSGARRFQRGGVRSRKCRASPTGSGPLLHGQEGIDHLFRATVADEPCTYVCASEVGRRRRSELRQLA